MDKEEQYLTAMTTGLTDISNYLQAVPVGIPGNLADPKLATSTNALDGSEHVESTREKYGRDIGR